MAQIKKLNALLFDTRSIQNYIYSGNRLRTNIGASYIVDRVFYDILIDEVLKDMFPEDDFSDLSKSVWDFSKDDEILIVGAGLSSTLDYFESKEFDKISIFDFSQELIKFLQNKYNNEWGIELHDITKKNDDCLDTFDVIIDKGCLDCILSEPKNGE